MSLPSNTQNTHVLSLQHCTVERRFLQCLNLCPHQQISLSGIVPSCQVNWFVLFSIIYNDCMKAECLLCFIIQSVQSVERFSPPSQGHTPMVPALDQHPGKGGCASGTSSPTRFSPTIPFDSILMLCSLANFTPCALIYLEFCGTLLYVSNAA